MSAPFLSGWMEIRPEWIDHNGHLNMAYYSVLFDQGADQAFALLGFGPDYLAQRQLTTYTAEFHIRYLRELHLGDRVRSSVQIVDHDEKRLHIWQELYHEDGWRAATAECVALHIDRRGPKVVPMPDDILDRVTTMAHAHAALPRPGDLGRVMGLK